MGESVQALPTILSMAGQPLRVGKIFPSKLEHDPKKMSSWRVDGLVLMYMVVVFLSDALQYTSPSISEQSSIPFFHLE